MQNEFMSERMSNELFYTYSLIPTKYFIEIGNHGLVRGKYLATFLA